MSGQDYSTYLRFKNCKCAQGETGAQGIQGETGAQGIQGETGAQGPSIQTALLFFSDISANMGDNFIEYDESRTINNGNELFITNAGVISFSDLSNCLVEIYCHCDSYGNGGGGNDNYIICDLTGINIEANSISKLDIDTRSVNKTDITHVTFGPTTYKILNTTSINNIHCINNSNTYKFNINVGKTFSLHEIKLSMKIIHL